MEKYQLIPEGEFFRLVALKDFGQVKAGDFGGLVSWPYNLSQEGMCWVGTNAMAIENARVEGDACVRDNARVSGSAWVSGRARVLHDAHVYENSAVSGDAWIYGYAEVCGYAEVEGDTEVSDYIE